MDLSKFSGYETNVFGTPNYISPEIPLNDKGLKQRCSADIWALGVTLYEMLFRRLPFTKNS